MVPMASAANGRNSSGVADVVDMFLDREAIEFVERQRNEESNAIDQDVVGTWRDHTEQQALAADVPSLSAALCFTSVLTAPTP